jgi:hypothetical protein
MSKQIEFNLNRKPRIFTWHIHGSYLYYLSQGEFEIYIPVNEKKTEGYYGRGETYPFGNNVHEVRAEEVRFLEFDCILFQTNTNYLVDQYEVLSDLQRELPAIYLEHDPPWKHPTDTKHIMNDRRLFFVHVTHFNKLMWDNNNISCRVIEHGVTMPEINYSGEMERGIVVINNLPARGRLLGLDIFKEVRKYVPIDLVGMGTEGLGLGEVLHPQLPGFISHYRFFFHPVRYTSLGLSVCEAMMAGMPVIGLATTELATVIENGVNGYIHTDIGYLVGKMEQLLMDKDHADEIGMNARQTAQKRFNIKRFCDDWKSVFLEAIEKKVNSEIGIFQIHHQPGNFSTYENENRFY